MKPLIKPQKLRRGDCVAVISPSYPDAPWATSRVNQSLNFLKSLGLEATLMPHALSKHSSLPYLVASPKELAADINQAFADPTISAILSTEGGENCNALLEFIDYQLIKKNPKIFLGYSDITTLILAIHSQTGLVTFHGPNLLSLGAFLKLPAYTIRYYQDLLFGNSELIKYDPAKLFCDKSVTVEDKVYDSDVDIKMVNNGWEFLKSGEARGHLIGGNLESLIHLRGTEFWPDFQGALLFWEELDSTVASIHEHLTDLKLSGVFNKISGMVVGRIADASTIWTDETAGKLKSEDVFKEMLLAVTNDFNFPILINTDIGHTRPTVTLPIGVMSKINKDASISLLESPTD